MQKSFRLSFCAIMATLATAVMILTGVIPIATYALPGIAGVLFLPIVIEYGFKPAIYAYAVAALLSVFLAADKEAVVLFILFFGYYPIFKLKLRNLKSSVIKFTIKVAVFNITAVVSYVFAAKVLLIPEESLIVSGVSLPYILLIFGNFIFLIYDYAVSLIFLMYMFKIRPYIKFCNKLDK